MGRNAYGFHDIFEELAKHLSNTDDLQQAMESMMRQGVEGEAGQAQRAGRLSPRAARGDAQAV